MSTKMGFLIAMGINAAVWLAGYAWRRYVGEPRVNGPKPSDFSAPRHEAGSRLPLAYGRVLVASPVILSNGDYGFRPTDTDGVYNWYASVQYGLCRTNVVIAADQGNYTQLVRMWVGERPCRFVPNPEASHAEWAGMIGPYNWIVQDQATFNSGAFGTINVNAGVFGALCFRQGRPLEAVSADSPNELIWDYYTRLHNGVEDAPGAIPHRGTATVLLTAPPTPASWVTAGGPDLVARGFRWGTSPSLPQVKFEIVNPVAIPGVNPAFMDINAGDANPIGVLYDLLVNKEDGRCGHDPSSVDLTNFGNMALICWLEQNGFSRLYYQDTEVKNIIEDVERQIDGKLYLDPETNKWRVKLTREDYDVETLPLLDAGNIIKVVKFEQINWDSVANKVRLTFTAREKPNDTQLGVTWRPSYDRQTIDHTNQALASITSTVDPVEVVYPGVSNVELAARLLTRDVRALTLPLTRATLLVNRDSFYRHPNDVVKATHPYWGGGTYVFRVADVDIGEFEANAIALELIEDRWAVDYTAVDPANPTQPPRQRPVDIEEAVLEEAPRFWLHLGTEAGRFNDPDVARMWYLVHRETPNDAYRGGISLNDPPDSDNVIYSNDTDRVQHGGSFVVENDYSRLAEPYDTTNGLDIEALDGWAPSDATNLQIRTQGRNVIYVGGELMAYESYVDNGGGSYTLENVWRGLAGTAPVEHLAGARGYVIDRTRIMPAIGRTGLGAQDLVYAAVAGALGGVQTSYEEAQANVAELSVRRRPLLPGTVADLNIGLGTVLGVYQTPGKTPGDMYVEGLNVNFKGRDRTDTQLRRGDSAHQTQPDVGTEFTLVVYKDGEDRVLLSNSTDPEFEEISMSEAGYGDVLIGVESFYLTALGGGLATMASWQVPTLEVRAFEWRNLLMNPRHTGGSMDHWTTLSGTPVATGTGPAFGAAAVVGDGADSTVEWRQHIDVTNWRPGGMQALVEFFVRRNSDTNDTVEVTLQSTDDGVVQDTQTYGPSAPATADVWTRESLMISSVTPGCDGLRVVVEQVAIDPPEPDTLPSTSIAEFELQLGQISTQLLSNPSFESGLTDWTVDVGNFTDETSAAKEGTHRVQGAANAVNTIYQETAVPAGWHNAYAVLEASCYHPGPSINASATVTIQARDGVTVFDVGTTTITPSVDSAWFKVKVYCTVPTGTVELRATLTGTRLSGSDNLLSFDDVRLRVHKKLDPSFTREYAFAPTRQPLPTNLAEWRRTYDMGPPRRGLFTPNGLGNGTEQGQVAVIGDTRLDARVCGFIGSDGQTSVPAWEFRRGDVCGLRLGGAFFGNWRTSQSFTVRVVFDETVDGLETTFAARWEAVDGVGWQLGYDADGFAYARLGDGTNVYEANVGVDTCRGRGLNYLALVYDADADTVTVHTRGLSATTSTVGMGEIRPPELTGFINGVAVAHDPSQDEQWSPTARIASIEFWESAEDVDSLWVAGSDAALTGSVLVRGVLSPGTSVATVIGSDAGGVVVAYHGHGQDVHAAPDGERVGLACGRARTNLIDPNPNVFGGDWDDSAASEVLYSAARACDGSYTAVSVLGSISGFRQLTTPALANLGLVNLTFFVKAAAAGTAQVELLTAADVSVDIETFSVTTEWQRIDVTFNGWAGTTAAHINFSPTTAPVTPNTIYLAGPFFLDQDQNFGPPVVIPVVGATEVRYTQEAINLPGQFNHEGEVDVECRGQRAAMSSGTIVDIQQSGDNNRRRLRANANTAVLAHHDATGTGVESETGGLTWSDDQRLRGRWNRAGLLDQAGVFAGIKSEASSDYDRGSIFTAGDVGADNISFGCTFVAEDDVADCVIYSATIRAREKIL